MANSLQSMHGCCFQHCTQDQAQLAVPPCTYAESLLSYRKQSLWASVCSALRPLSSWGHRSPPLQTHPSLRTCAPSCTPAAQPINPRYVTSHDCMLTISQQLLGTCPACICPYQLQTICLFCRRDCRILPPVLSSRLVNRSAHFCLFRAALLVLLRQAKVDACTSMLNTGLPNAKFPSQSS